MAIRVLITDDHGVVRQGLRMFLSLDPDIEVVGEAENGLEALEMARELGPDVVLMDLLMPVMDGVEATKAIRSELSEVEVVALTSVLEDTSVTAAVRAGAIGYLLKDTEAEELHRAIKGAAEGRVQLAPEAAAKLMGELRASQHQPPHQGQGQQEEEEEEEEEVGEGGGGEGEEEERGEGSALSEGERQVLRLVARGESNKQIASELEVEEKAVKAEVLGILRKLGVRSRTQAALYAVKAELVSIEELGGPRQGDSSRPEGVDRRVPED